MSYSRNIQLLQKLFSISLGVLVCGCSAEIFNPSSIPTQTQSPLTLSTSAVTAVKLPGFVTASPLWNAGIPAEKPLKAIMSQV